jgi:hypothetical protein
MRHLLCFASIVAVALLPLAAVPVSEAPTGFDNKSNGTVDDLVTRQFADHSLRVARCIF